MFRVSERDTAEGHRLVYGMFSLHSHIQQKKCLISEKILFLVFKRCEGDGNIDTYIIEAVWSKHGVETYTIEVHVFAKREEERDMVQRWCKNILAFKFLCFIVIALGI